MIIEITLDQADWKQFLATVTKELANSRRTFFDSAGFNVIVWMIFAILFWAIFGSIRELHWPSFGAATFLACVIFGYWIFQSLRLREAFRPSKDGLCLAHQIYEITENGIEAKAKGHSSTTSWEVVQKISRLNGQILIFLDTALVLIFPENKLDKPDEFYAHILKFHSNS